MTNGAGPGLLSQILPFGKLMDNVLQTQHLTSPGRLTDHHVTRPKRPPVATKPENIFYIFSD
jgi:hypothetical protein